MAFCKNCGTDMGNANFCPKCGTEAFHAESNFEEKFSDIRDSVDGAFEEFNNTPDTTSDYDAADIANNKTLCVFAYLGFLVLIPFFASPKDSRFAKFHVNQGLVLFIAGIVWEIVKRIIDTILALVLSFALPGLYTLISTLLGLLGLVFTVLAVIGIVNVVQGKAKELPIIGGIRILK